MRARSWGGLTTALVLAMLLPATVSAQSGNLAADNPDNRCQAPLPASIVTGDLGSTVEVRDEAEIDKITLASEPGAAVEDVEWHEDGHEVSITATADVSAYVVWSCAPMSGEPVQENDGQDV